jgi:hypothetical protein
LTSEERLAQLECRIALVEADRDRLLNAMKEAAKMALQNPMVVAMMPKAMKEQLRAYTERH